MGSTMPTESCHFRIERSSVIDVTIEGRVPDLDEGLLGNAAALRTDTTQLRSLLHRLASAASTVKSVRYTKGEIAG